jgi:hypothetical protein
MSKPFTSLIVECQPRHPRGFRRVQRTFLPGQPVTIAADTLTQPKIDALLGSDPRDLRVTPVYADLSGPKAATVAIDAPVAPLASPDHGKGHKGRRE